MQKNEEKIIEKQCATCPRSFRTNTPGVTQCRECVLEAVEGDDEPIVYEGEERAE